MINIEIVDSTIKSTYESLEEEIIHLKKEKELLEEQVKDLSRKAFYDQLTGLESRLALDEKMGRYFKRICEKIYTPERRREILKDEESLVFAIFDIDKFKDVNDAFGHEVGDKVLRAVAEKIKGITRDSDIVARWGGEEIVVVFSGATLRGAESKANLIREKVSEIKIDEEPGLKVTISAGLAHSSGFKKEEDLFKAADKALYESKQNGRNRVTAYSETSDKFF